MPQLDYRRVTLSLDYRNAPNKTLSPTQKLNCLRQILRENSGYRETTRDILANHLFSLTTIETIYQICSGNIILLFDDNKRLLKIEDFNNYNLSIELSRTQLVKDLFTVVSVGDYCDLNGRTAEEEESNVTQTYENY
jgi:hypothetical protein